MAIEPTFNKVQAATSVVEGHREIARIVYFPSLHQQNYVKEKIFKRSYNIIYL